MVNLYVTPDEVRMWLRVSPDDYPDDYLTMLIRMKMDYIDKVTRTTWAGNRRIAKEYHDLSMAWWKGGFMFGNGIMVDLAYQDVKEFLKIEIRNLNSVYDITKNGGYVGGDWFYDNTTGQLFIMEFVFYRGGKELYVEYLYGRDDLPGTIKEWCLLLVVKDILMNDRYIWQIAGNDTTVNVNEILRQINQRVKEIEAEYRPLLTGGTASRVHSYYVE